MHLRDHNHFGKLHFNAESPAHQGGGTSPFEREIVQLYYPNLCWKWLERNCERNLLHAGKHLAFTVVF